MIAAIQAGGRSLRMGEDKAWLTIDGRPMIEQVLTTARAVADRLAIVINPSTPNMAQYQQLAAAWQAEVIDDLHDYRGPLGGIETALRQCEEGESVLILACDLPFLSEAFLQLLAQIHQAEKSELTVPLDETGRPQMLAAIYAATCLQPISAMLAANELKARLLQKRVSTREASFAEYAHLPNAGRFLVNVNTLEDHQRIEG